MGSVVDERGFNQGYCLSAGHRLRLHRRAIAIAREMSRSDKAFSDAESARVLEIGCGTGELAFDLLQLTGACITGVDLSRRFIDQANAAFKQQKLSFVVRDLREPTWNLESEKYNFIVGNGVLHHLYGDLDTFLPRLRNTLVPGGRLIFWEPNLFNPYVFAIFSVPVLRRAARLEPAEMAFTPSFIRKKLVDAEFVEVRAATRDFLVPHVPEALVPMVVKAGDFLERSPLRIIAQSIFLTAAKT